ncbi:tRNA 2-selenouridine(34) synthase MnmH [Pseudomonas syringae pv. actinidiae]|nr:tRNA 2-selenouridine(34) synthase MnmH [Pseudomonas syringae pv. actinidiae]
MQLGHQLVCGQVKDERVEAWVEFARANPNGYLYCFRGGLRSQTVQRWLKDAGVDYPRILGGYKAMRTFLLDTLHEAVSECDLVVLGGMTGTGKTEVLTQLPNGLDLEGVANHRGSSFGKRATGQPAQIDFENRLAIDLLKKRAAGIEQFVVEDESRLVGSCNVPLELHQAMQGWSDGLAGRQLRAPRRAYSGRLRGQPLRRVHQRQGRRTRLRAVRRSPAAEPKQHSQTPGRRASPAFAALMQTALEEQQRSGAVELHRGWIEGLLGEYYDPMYAYQREHKAARIEFAGNQFEVSGYLSERSSRR